jgi:ABC-type lipoprotein export system ATPase subunit
LARALIHQPSILLADEPTGNLDSTSSTMVIDLITRLARQEKTTVVLVTHSEVIARTADRGISLVDGRIQS